MPGYSRRCGGLQLPVGEGVPVGVWCRAPPNSTGSPSLLFATELVTVATHMFVTRWQLNYIAEAGFGLLAVTLFSGADFQIKGGRGRIRAWATRESALLRVIGAYMLRLNLRTAAARHPKVVVLKQIIGLKQAAEGIPVEQAAVAGEVEDSVPEEAPLMLELLPADSQQAREDEAMEEQDAREAHEAAASKITHLELPCEDPESTTTAAGIQADPSSEDQQPTATGMPTNAASKDQESTAGSAASNAASKDEESTTTGSILRIAASKNEESTATGSIPTDAASKDRESTAIASMPTDAAGKDQEATATASMPTDAAGKDQESTAAASMPTDAAGKVQESTTAGASVTSKSQACTVAFRAI